MSIVRGKLGQLGLFSYGRFLVACRAVCFKLRLRFLGRIVPRLSFNNIIGTAAKLAMLTFNFTMRFNTYHFIFILFFSWGGDS